MKNNLLMAFVWSLFVSGCGSGMSGKPSEDEMKKLLVDNGFCYSTKGTYVAGKELQEGLAAAGSKDNAYDWIEVSQLKLVNGVKTEQAYEAELEFSFKLKKDAKELHRLDGVADKNSPPDAVFYKSPLVPVRMGYCIDDSESTTSPVIHGTVKFMKGDNGWMMRSDRT